MVEHVAPAPPAPVGAPPGAASLPGWDGRVDELIAQAEWLTSPDRDAAFGEIAAACAYAGLAERARDALDEVESDLDEDEASMSGWVSVAPRYHGQAQRGLALTGHLEEALAEAKREHRNPRRPWQGPEHWGPGSAELRVLAGDWDAAKPVQPAARPHYVVCLAEGGHGALAVAKARELPHEQRAACLAKVALAAARTGQRGIAIEAVAEAEALAGEPTAAAPGGDARDDIAMALARLADLPGARRWRRSVLPTTLARQAAAGGLTDIDELTYGLVEGDVRWIALSIVSVLAEHGSWDAAGRLARRCLRDSPAPSFRGTDWDCVAALAVAGYPERAMAIAEAAYASMTPGPYRARDPLYCFGHIAGAFAFAGDLDRARQMSRRWADCPVFGVELIALPARTLLLGRFGLEVS